MSMEANYEDELPREDPVLHNGTTLSFLGFWWYFERRIVNHPHLSEISKLSRLYTALCQHDRDATINLSLEECKEYLFKKYRSEEAIRECVVEGFAFRGMKSSLDRECLCTIIDKLERYKNLVKSAEPDAVSGLTRELFSIVYAKLDEKTQMNYWSQASARRGNLDDMLQYLYRAKSAIYGHKWAMSWIPEYAVEKSPNCYYCGEPGHIVKRCPKRKSAICFKCSRPGHLARRCVMVKPGIQVATISEVRVDERPHCSTKVKDKEFTSIADPGSLNTVFPAVQADTPMKTKIDMADGSVVFPEGTSKGAKSEQPAEKAQVKRKKQMERMKRNYERHGIRRVNVKRDELVVWHVHEQGVGKSRKLIQRWKGPFRVVEVQKPNVLLAVRDGKTKLVHPRQEDDESKDAGQVSWSRTTSNPEGEVWW